MNKTTVALAATSALLSSLLTATILVASTPASGSSTSGSVTSVQYGNRQGAKIIVAPGDVGESIVTCPTGWHAVSGGYVITGYVGISVPSAVENAIGYSGKDWYVQIANPKASSGDIAFRAEVNCTAAVY